MDRVRSTAALRGDVLAVSVQWSRWLVLGTVVLCLFARGLPAAAENVFALVLVAAGLLAGLPHGSIDHRLAARLTGWPTPVVATGYAVVAVLTWVLLVTTGPVALLPVLVLSLVHFALGELEVIRETARWRPSRAVQLTVGVAATGALLLPLARSGRQLADVAVSISPQLGVLLAAGPSRIALAAVWASAALLAVAAALRARHYSIVVDIMLVGALGALAPPLVAFAVWFGGWHALRHSARLLTLEQRSAALLERGQLQRAIGALARVAAGPTLAAVVVLAALLVVTVTAAEPTAAVGATLVVLLALTVPHMLVVLWIDHRGAIHPQP